MESGRYGLSPCKNDFATIALGHSALAALLWFGGEMTNISADARFMRNTGIVLLLLSVLAFAPRYFAPLMAGSYQPPSSWMHPHAISAMLWALIFIIQPWLIVQNKPALHRRIGFVSCIVAVINVVSGIAVQLDILPTTPEDFSNVVGGGFRVFHSVPAFVLFFVAALAMRRRPDWHLRFMYQTAIAAVATVLGRLYLFYGQLPGEIISVLIPLGNLGFVLLLPIYDYLKYRKVHPASWIGVAAFFAFQVIVTPIVFSDLWINFATGN